MAPVIKAKDLYKCYPGFPPVLRGVNIEVEPGEMVAIMGPSGCGKSTMLHVLGMLHAPDSGSLEILGENVLALDNQGTAAFRRGNMGFVMQASNLFEHSTVFENVEFPLIYENVPPQERWERVIRALELVRLSARVHYRSNRLSGGEQQRVAIARAMVNNPRILLADEPTGALDAKTSRVIMENFRNLCHKGGVAMVMVTHDPKMAEYCDTIYTLEDGVLRCQKHEPPKLSLEAGRDFLHPPKPEVPGALVASHFPASGSPWIMSLAGRLHGQRLLARIYALAKNGFLASSAGYSLPLAVRRICLWQKLAGALKGQSSIKTSAAIVAKWCKADGIRFLYAAGAERETATAMEAGRLCGLPFAFTLSPAQAAALNASIGGQAQAAAFVVCPTEAVKNRLLDFCPELPAAKILLLPNPPLFALSDEESELPRQPGEALTVLVTDFGGKYGKMAIEAARELKRQGINFRLVAAANKTWRARWRVFCAGLRSRASFAGSSIEGSADAFRSADVFVAWPPDSKGMELALPWQLEEMMALGKACIALAISPGMAILRDSENCLTAANAADLAKKLRELATFPDKRAALGATARRQIWDFINLEANSSLLAEKIKTAVKKDPAVSDGAAQKHEF